VEIRRGGKTHLVEQYGKEDLENQQYNPEDQASIRSGAFNKRGGILESENDQAEDQ
jgi:hypothetical protein